MTIVPQFDDVRVLCVGDVMLDRFVQGDVARISPESPVPVILIGDSESRPGGAANVGRNVSALGGRCTLIGCVGDDAAARELADALSACGRIESVLVAQPGRPTIEKTRFVAQGQHILRADRERPGPIAAVTEDDVVAEVERRLPDHDVLVLSDYAKGLLTDSVVARTIAAAQARAVPVVVDPKSARLARYAGATVVTPNAGETLAATGIDPHEDDAAGLAGRAVLDTASVAAVLVTRAARGMTLVERDGAPIHLPASAREVFDVVGAGDTVVATLALMLGSGAALADAARTANAAGGLVVGKRGTATLTRTELHDELARLAAVGPDENGGKVADAALAAARRRRWADEGLRVGFTNGCFDILHVGHLRLLEFARAHCDRLVVGLNTDASARRLKGPSRPVNGEDDRAELLAALGPVDLVVPFDEDTPAGLIAALSPDLLVKGADYTVDRIVGADLVLAAGGEVLTCALAPGRSTTGIIARAAGRERAA